MIRFRKSNLVFLILAIIWAVIVWTALDLCEQRGLERYFAADSYITENFQD